MTNENNEHVPAISVVMPVYNAEQYIKESIESIINQSFTDFECIIVDDGSDDHTPDIINTIVDERIIVIASSHDFVKSLNKGVSAARGKYIARMDADDIMHPDRLRIQYEIMETELSITVCSTWMRPFGKNISPGRISQSICGLVEYPLLAFLQGNFVFHPTTMIRKSFLDENTLLYEHYPYAEDLKLWKEIALRGGGFYVESQTLLNYRISDSQVTMSHREEQMATAKRIMDEIICYLIHINKEKYPALEAYLVSLNNLKEQNLITFENLVLLIQQILRQNKTRLKLK